MNHQDIVTSVKLRIFETIALTTKPPKAAEVAEALNVNISQVLTAFEGLHAKRLLVPEPDDPTRIRMAPPFSGIETPFRVRVGAKDYYANCAWDAFGIPAALHADAVILAADGHTGERMALEVRDGSPIEQPCVFHFAVPAARWWDDIIFT